jgi:DNA-directed RNA polymerase subunit H (RpoH/RPB5)
MFFPAPSILEIVLVPRKEGLDGKSTYELLKLLGASPKLLYALDRSHFQNEYGEKKGNLRLVKTCSSSQTSNSAIKYVDLH